MTVEVAAGWRIVPYEGHAVFKKVRVRDEARVQAIVRHLQADECVALLGPPLNEKSRLLKDAAGALADEGRHLAVFVDLWKARSNDEAAFFRSIAGLIGDTLGVCVPRPREPVTSARAFQNYVTACAGAQDRSLALMVDHLQALPHDLVHSLMVALRSTYMEREADAPNQIVAVVTGGMNLVGLSTGPTSPFNIAKPVVAGPLTADQSLALAAATFEALGTRVSDGALELLAEWARGDRYLIPYLCHQAAQAAGGGVREGVTRTGIELVLRHLWDEDVAVAPVREAIRMIEEDPDTLLDVLYVLDHEALPRSRARNMITRTGTDRLQLSGALVLVDGHYRPKNLVYRDGLARHFTTERVGHVLRIAGRWREAIDYLAPRLASEPQPSARPQLLEAIVQSIYATDTLERSFEILAEGLRLGFGHSDVGLYQARPAQGALLRIYPARDSALPASVSLDDRDAVEARAYHYGNYALRGTPSEARLVAALAAQHRPVGVVTVERYVQQRDPHELPSDLPDLLRFLTHAASAVENVMVRAAFRKIGQAALGTASVEATWLAVLDAVAEALGCDFAALHLVDAGETWLENVAGVGRPWSPEWLRLARTPLQGNHPAAQCLTNRLRNVVARGTDERLDRTFVDRFGLHNHVMVYVPLRAADAQLGTLELGYAGGLHLSLTEENRRVLTVFADQVAIAVYNQRLLQRTDQALARRVSELEKLRSSSLAVSSTLDLDAVLDRITRDLQALFPSTEATVWAYHAASDDFSVLQTTLADGGYRSQRCGNDSLAGQAVVLRQTMTGADLMPAGDYWSPDPAVDLGLQGMVAVPLLSHDRVLGAIALYSKEVVPPAQGEEELLEAFAAQAAMALDNARLHKDEIARQRLEEELAVARQIQLSMLPKEAPSAAGWEFRASYRAARIVGGDFYDFCELPGSPPRLGLVIADVADKSVPAALFMALSRTIIRTTALSGRTPGSALVRANELILNDSQAGLFLTAVYAVLELPSGRLTYANAGHNQPLWYHAATGEVEPLNAKGILLGMFEQIKLEERRIDIAPGDALVFYTDGITETLGPDGEMFGEERLAAVMQAHAGHSAREILAAIDEAVQTYAAGAEPADDIACFVVKRI